MKKSTIPKPEKIYPTDRKNINYRSIYNKNNQNTYNDDSKVQNTILSFNKIERNGIGQTINQENSYNNLCLRKNSLSKNIFKIENKNKNKIDYNYQTMTNYQSNKNNNYRKEIISNNNLILQKQNSYNTYKPDRILTSNNNFRGGVKKLTPDGKTSNKKSQNINNVLEGLIIQIKNLLDKFKIYENSINDKNELYNQNIANLKLKIKQINEILERQDKKIQNIYQKDDRANYFKQLNNYEIYKNNLEYIKNLETMNIFLKNKINKKNKAINYLEEENKKYKNLNLKLEKNFDELNKEYKKIKNDLENFNLNETNLKKELHIKTLEITKNNQIINSLNVELDILKNKNLKLQDNIYNKIVKIRELKDNIEKIKLYVDNPCSEIKSIFDSMNNFNNEDLVEELLLSEDEINEINKGYAQLKNKSNNQN